MRPKSAGRVNSGKRDTGQYSEYSALDTGLVQGAMLLTLDGEIPVEFLSVGNQVITRDTGISKVRHIQAETRSVKLISLATDCLGTARPDAATRLAADQMVLIRDWRAKSLFQMETVLVAARALLECNGVKDLGAEVVTLYQVFCDRPHILYCDGLELSTADGAKARGAVLHAA